jgi:phage terminase small subunit
MGGKGSGGARLGAGRPRKNQIEHWLGGDAGRRHGKAPPKPRAVVSDAVEPPADLPELHREIWERYAPHAREAGTLTKGTAGAFRDLCEAIVVRDGLMTAIHQQGYVVGEAGVKHPLLAEWRQVAQQVRTAMKEFRLAPLGKPMATEPEAPVDPFAEFEGAPVN